MKRGQVAAYLFVCAVAAFLLWRGEETRQDESRHNREAQIANCEAVNASYAALRNLLVSARRQTPPERLTPTARRFYHEQITALTPLDCGNFTRRSLGWQGGKRHRGGDAPTAGEPPKSPP